MTKTYRAALIGCGRMGATIDDEVRDHPLSYLWLPYSHAAAVVACDRTELVAVSDVDGEKAEAIRQRYEVPVCYADYKEMIKKEALDIVCIATRPATHAEMVVFAAENGVKGIYCEKPLCCSMAEADAMVAAVEREFAGLAGVSWFKPQGGMYVWMRLPEQIETGFTSPLFHRATQVDKVMFVPGELSYPAHWQDRPRCQMRLSFGVQNVAGIEEGIRRLASAVRWALAVQPQQPESQLQESVR